MRTLNTAIVLTMALSAAGCTAQARSPEPVPLDRVECARCRMLISTDTGGGQIVSANEETRFYDDIACLAADWPAHRDGTTAYVRLTDGAWSDARDASYAQPATAHTAMGSGFTAFATIAAARASDRDGPSTRGLRDARSGQGRVLSWDEVVKRAGERR